MSVSDGNGGYDHDCSWSSFMGSAVNHFIQSFVGASLEESCSALSLARCALCCNISRVWE